MSESQAHGKEVEKIIAQSNVFPGFTGIEKYTADVDIPAKFDNISNIPTHVKTLHIGRNIDMGDARRFWNLTAPARLLLFEYKQITDTEKQIVQVKECILTDDFLKKVKGNISIEQITEFHNGLSIQRFPEGKHDDARKFHRAFRKKLKDDGYYSLINLRPKVDSKTQRRLQCSIPAEIINQEIKIQDITTIYRGYNFNVIIQSEKRKRNKKS